MESGFKIQKDLLVSHLQEKLTLTFLFNLVEQEYKG